MKRIAILILALVLLAAMSLVMAAPAGAYASLTGTGYWTHTYHWTIDKSVTPDTWNLFCGDSGTSQYTITVTKDQGTDEAWIEGQVFLRNWLSVPMENLAIVIELRDGVPPPADLIATANVDLSSNPVLDVGESASYNYRINIPSANLEPSGYYSVTARITITNYPGQEGTPYFPPGLSPRIYLYLPASPTSADETINVDDTNGGTWAFSDSGSVSYTKTFTCDADQGTHSNTATIRETGQSASASVTVNCYAIQVTKDATPSFKRTYKWDIGKLADQSKLTLAKGEQLLTNYNVRVSITSITDSGWAVQGKISVYNPAPIPARINSISDIISGVGAAIVDFGAVSFPYDLPAGETLQGTYSASLPDASSRTNTATATLQNYDYDYLKNPTPSGTTDFSGPAAVDFSKATITEIDECITVSDTYAGYLGTVCAGDAPKTFYYSRWIGPYETTCNNYKVENTASFVTNDTNTTGSSSWTVNVTVPCGGCTLTQGYWKTHSWHGPASKPDATWNQIKPSGVDSTFFISGQTYYQVMWTSPSGGNVYYQLAHQYIAAKLNILKGTSSPATVNAAISWAENNFFNKYGPKATLPSAVGKQAGAYASLLGNYNEGLIGPGHCSE